MGAAGWKRIKIGMPPRQFAAFMECVSFDGRSPAEIIRSLIEPWIASRIPQAAIMKGLTETGNAPTNGTTTALTLPSSNTTVPQKQGPRTDPASPPKGPSKGSKASRH